MKDNMGFILTFSAMMLAILLLAGCATGQGLSGEARHQASTLQCVGYCDLLITDKVAEVTADGKTEFKHGPDHDADDDDGDRIPGLGDP